MRSRHTSFPKNCVHKYYHKDTLKFYHNLYIKKRKQFRANKFDMVKKKRRKKNYDEGVNN